MIKKLTEPASSASVEIEDISTCPICNHSISPVYLSNRFHKAKTAFSVFCECPACGKPFVVFYANIEFKHLSGQSPKYIASSPEYKAPSFPQTKQFDDKICLISPNFVEIYNQALAAECYNLDQIAGIAYRKSLEFLIKDYCISKNPDKSSNIAKSLLAQCIEQYIDDSKIKSLAKVSTWIGNDETHYIRKIENKDINDLKRFIDTAVFFILYNLNVDEANDIINAQTK